MDDVRDLARAIALGDFEKASGALDMLVREELLDGHQVDIGRSDAANILRRSAVPAPLKKAA